MLKFPLRRGAAPLRRAGGLVESLERRLLFVSVPAGFTAKQIATGLDSPTALDVAADGRVFFSQQDGTIKILKNDAVLSISFAKLSVDHLSEHGMLGLTLDPNFASNHYVYVYYTNPSPASHNVLSRLTANGDTVVAGSEKVLLSLPNLPVGDNWHMGGGLHFGADGKIYLGVGDHEDTTKPQSLDSVFGKMLRVNSDGSIPTDNPFYTKATGINRAIWVYGLRNPYTFGVNHDSGRIFINDVGQDSWEEIDDGVAGSNYGWPLSEGYTSNTAFHSPIYSYPHDEGRCAITGGAFYTPRTSQFPADYRGKYFFADFCSGNIKRFDPTSKAVSSFISGASYPTNMTVTNDGSLYFIARGAHSGNEGAGLGSIWKVRYSTSTSPYISVQPAPQKVPAGAAATFSVVAGGSSLTYQWQKNGVNISGATSATYSIPATTLSLNGASYKVKASNSAGTVYSNSVVLTVVNGHAPTATITSPASGTLYKAGDVINFAGTASDAEDGVLPTSDFTWSVVFHHETHTHPFIDSLANVKSGHFTIPVTGETDPVVWYRIHLTVHDKSGLTYTTYRDVKPRVASVTLATNVPGLSINLDGQPRTTPITISGVVNLARRLEAPQTQTVGGVLYQFTDWSDHGASSHALSFPSANTTYTATYAKVSPVYLSDLPFAAAPINGWGPVELNTSNGSLNAGDGLPISIHGVTYSKGLGVHAHSELAYNLGGKYARFQSDIGIDAEKTSSGSVTFQVWADGSQIYSSALITRDSATQHLDLDVTGRQQLRLIVTDGGDGIDYDHADWAGARLILASAVDSVPIALAAPAPLDLSTQRQSAASLLQ